MLTESTNDWCFLGPLPLRRVSLYQKTSLPFDDLCLLAVCPYGGPVAIARAVDQTNWGIFIFTAKGEKLALVKALEVFKIAWTKCLKLIVIGRNGETRLLNVRGKEIAVFDMDLKFRDNSFVDVNVFNNFKDTGLAMMDTSNRIFIVNSVVRRLIWTLSDVFHQPSTPTAWTVVASTGPTSIILCYGEAIYVGSQSGHNKKKNEEWFFTDGGKYIACKTSWDNSKVVFIHSSGTAQVATSDLAYLLHVIALTLTPVHKHPFCDVLAFQKSPNEITFYSMTDNDYTLNFYRPVWFDVDSDGLRCFTKNEAHLVTIVPADLEHVLGLVTSQPGAYLYHAYEGSLKKDYNTFEYVTGIHSRLGQALEQCMNAAAHHYNSNVQKTLMMAVKWASALFIKFDSTKFVYLLNLLRCLNAVRQIGFPISFSELNEFTLENLVDRITKLQHWPLALSVCKTMNIEASVGSGRIMRNWTNVLLEEVATSGRYVEVDELASKICNQFLQFQDTNYAEIAEAIYNKGKNAALAIKVLQKEKDVMKQVQMLLKFDNVKEALEIANNSHLPNLAYMVINHLRQTRKTNDIDMLLLRQQPHAARLYQGLVREVSPNKMLALYEQSDDYLRQALMHIENSATFDNPFDPSQKSALLTKAEDCFVKLGNNDLSGLVKNTTSLYNNNFNYDQKNNTNLTNATLRDTFIFAVGNDPAIAEKLKKDHKLLDKQVMRWTIEGFVKAKNVTNLNDLTYKKNYPGHMVVVETCVRCNDLELARVFTNKIEAFGEKCRALCLFSEYVEAAQLAAEHNDLATLNTISLLCVDPSLKAQVRSFINTVKERLQNTSS